MMAMMINEQRTTTTTTRSAQHIVYPYELVDGIVTELGGIQLQNAIKSTIPLVKGSSKDYPIRCPTGEAWKVSTKSTTRMLNHFHNLISTGAPFWPLEVTTTTTTMDTTDVEDKRRRQQIKVLAWVASVCISE
jgi:hypothetical protein